MSLFRRQNPTGIPSNRITVSEVGARRLRIYLLTLIHRAVTLFSFKLRQTFSYVTKKGTKEYNKLQHGKRWLGFFFEEAMVHREL